MLYIEILRLDRLVKTRTLRNDNKNIFQIVLKVARVKKPVSSSEVDAEFGVSAYSKYGTRTVSTSLRGKPFSLSY